MRDEAAGGHSPQALISILSFQALQASQSSLSFLSFLSRLQIHSYRNSARSGHRALFGAIHWFSGKDTVIYASNANASRLLNSIKAEDRRDSVLCHGDAGSIPEAGAKAAEATADPDRSDRLRASGPEAEAKRRDNGGAISIGQIQDGWVNGNFKASRKPGWYELRRRSQAASRRQLLRVVRGIQIDGDILFLELEHLELERRSWKDLQISVRPERDRHAGSTSADGNKSDGRTKAVERLFGLLQAAAVPAGAGGA